MTPFVFFLYNCSSQEAVRMKSTDEVYGSLNVRRCTNMLRFNSMSQSQPTWQQATWRACAAYAH